MHPTKRQILDHLKRYGDASVDDLARALGLARITVRQHLMALERDRLVTSREVRRGSGRPHHLYTLSADGHDAYPKRYDRLALLLLDEAGRLEAGDLAGLSESEKRRALLGRALERAAAQYLPHLEGKPLSQRVQALARLMTEEGALAEWRRTAEGFEILDYNCLYYQVARVHGEVCQWHLDLLARVLGRPVRCDEFVAQGAHCCRFVVEETGPNTTTGGPPYGREEA